jgi:hypothetical protein
MELVPKENTQRDIQLIVFLIFYIVIRIKSDE